MRRIYPEDERILEKINMPSFSVLALGFEISQKRAGQAFSYDKYLV